MSLDVKIKDGQGSSNLSKVGPDGRLYIQESGIPPFGMHTETRVYRSYFIDSLGSNDMRVDGSVTSHDFIIEADQENDRYISSISFVISDTGAALDLFGGIPPLLNGVEIFYEDFSGLVSAHEGLKDNFDFIRLCQGNPSFGNGTTAFLAPDVSAPPNKSSAYIPVLDVKKTFGLQWGLRLEASSSQRIVIRIKDDIQAIDQFDAVAYGFDRLKE